MWELHPQEFHEILIHGKLVPTPRWQQAYGKDYYYTNRTNRALPVPKVLLPFLEWGQQSIDPRLDGLLVNWYDGKLGHYIGRHRDSIEGIVEGPIVTISLGEERKFRLRPWRGEGRMDFVAQHGTVFIMPYETNLAWTHEVPKSSRCQERRISVTLRGFV
ncbi:MAG: alpha-ketoglutarate-dependent dioxygenase AlkB [Planctomycetota bacterium]